MNFSAKALIKALEANGFVFKRSKVSHRIYFNKNTDKTIVVPMHGNKDIAKGTFLSILKQAGLSQDDI
ncbi:MAG: type II toxin-antitoxin system HicA family toxin [Chitinophagaceae bacterium]|nr:MAG: type II toxin-antitoxin system HicA family toxin [Chitinophagaceae bacterium]